MRCLVLGCGLLAWAWLPGCGGQVEGGGSDPEGSGSSSTPSSDPKAAHVDADEAADTELGSCQLGRPANQVSSQPCAWIADKRCYDARDMACNCVCPRSRTSQCVSGFEAGPDGRVSVDCD